RKWSEFVQPSDVQRMREYQLRRLREPSAAPRSYEYKGYDRQGNLRDVLLTAAVIPGTRRTLANLLDITERKKIEEELRRLKDFNEGIVEGMAEGLVLEDSEGRITFVNRALETMLGYQRAELIGWSWTQLVAPDHIESIRARMAGRREGASEVYESYFLDKAGRQVPVLISARALMEGGRYHGSLSAITDMREREQLEEQLRQAQKLEMLGVIAGGVAHSFNNLLTVIRGNAQLVLAEEGLTEQLRHDLEVIDGAAQRGALLTQQLLTFSRRRVLQPVATDLNRLVRDFVQLIGPVLGGDITVQTDLTTAALPVLADASAVEQVLMNLSVNARDAMPDGGTLTFETAAVSLPAGAAECRPAVPPGDYVRVSVTDTGQGMGPEVIAHLFEPFYSTKEVGRGTGLGLSVAYGIVQQHQGCIEVQSAPGQGARFDIYFPARAADQPRKQEG
ncbi:MAG TPA: PAS domain S-box protein, partial [Anaerolineae bacterium]|nr:PAS domain S-box protein [Anaerolineae bacterium]